MFINIVFKNHMDYRNVFITETDAINGLKNCNLWLSSHGGIGSEYLTEKLNIKYLNRMLPNKKNFSAVIVHYNKPVPVGPKKAIFLYGDLYNSICSQIRRHPINGAKIGNNLKYPQIHSLNDMFRLVKHNNDPFNIGHMFRNFMRCPVTYPMLLMRYNPSSDVIKQLKDFVGKDFVGKDFEYKFKKRTTDFLSVSNKKQIRQMTNIYGTLYWTMNEMPPVIIRYPTTLNYTLNKNDVTNNVCSPPHPILKPNVGKLLQFCKFDNTSYGLYYSDETGLKLYNYDTEKYVILFIEKNSNLIKKTNVSVCKNIENIYVILNIDPLTIVKIDDITTGKCSYANILTNIETDIETNIETDIETNVETDIETKNESCTNYMMWNYPYYVSFGIDSSSKLQSYIFDSSTLTIHKKKIDYEVANNYRLYGFNIEDTQIKLYLTDDKDSNSVKTLSYTLDFIGFCKHFNIDDKIFNEYKALKVLKVESKVPNNLHSENKFVGRLKHYSENDDYITYDSRSVIYKGEPITYFSTGDIKGGGYITVFKKNEEHNKINTNINVNYSHEVLHYNSKKLRLYDSRLFKFRNINYVLFYAYSHDCDHYGDEIMKMYIYNLESEAVIKISVKDFDVESQHQKNWIPYVYNDKLYFIYSIKPTCVLEVTDIDKGKCIIVKGNPSEYDDEAQCYGSTPLVQWTDTLFVGFAHRREPWLSIPVVYDAEEMKFTKILETYNFALSGHLLSKPWRGKYVQFPYMLRVIDETKTVILGLELQDRCPTWYYLDYDSFVEFFGIGEKTFIEKKLKVLKIKTKVPKNLNGKNFTANRLKHYSENDNVITYDTRGVVYNRDPRIYNMHGMLHGGGHFGIYIKKKDDPLINNIVNIGYSHHIITYKSKVMRVQDSRLFDYKGEDFLIFNSFIHTSKPDATLVPSMFLYNIEEKTTVKLTIKDNKYIDTVKQKNWTPYVYNEELYIIYSYHPICVLKVSNLKKGECELIKGDPTKYDNNKNCYGSTPLVQWTEEMFIGFSHSRSPWFAVPIIYNAKSMELVKIFDYQKFMLPNHPLSKPWRMKYVQFPYMLRVIDKTKTVILGVEIQDRCPTWYYLDYNSFVDFFGIGEKTFIANKN